MYHGASIVWNPRDVREFYQAFCVVSVLNEGFDLDLSIRFGKGLNRKKTDIGSRFFGAGANVSGPSFSHTPKNASFTPHGGEE